MTKQKIEEQTSYLLAIQGILCESALLMNPLLQKMLNANREDFTFEAKQHCAAIIKHIKGLSKHLEYFEQQILPAARTAEGKEDCVSVYDALVKDGYIMLRIACKTYNARMNSDYADMMIEKAIEEFTGEPKKLDPEIINKFRLITKPIDER